MVIVFIYAEILIELITTIFSINHNSLLWFTPNYLYKHSKMNILGCIICSILIITLLHVYCIPAILGWIIYKIFHIGRKVDN